MNGSKVSIYLLFWVKLKWKFKKLIFVEGPKLPVKLNYHAMVRIGYDLIVIGGTNENKNQSGALYKLSCWNHNCKWEKLTQKLKIPREEFVAIPIPESFITCE